MELLDLSSDQIAYIAFAVIAAIVAFIIIKKVAGCIIKTVVFAILLAILAWLYLNYISEPVEDQANQVTTEERI